MIRSGPVKSAALQAALIVGAAVLMLGGGRRDFDVPLRFSGDGLIFQALSKGTYDNGWWWHNPWLSAPSSYDALAFPANANVDQALVRVASLFARSPALALTVAWIGSLALGGLIAGACFRRLGLSPLASFVFGTLYGLSPYALYRDVSHFNLLSYLVPLPCTLALVLACDRTTVLGRRTTVGLMAACCLLGFNYSYYAFFGCFFVVVAGLAGSLVHRSWRPGMLGVAATLLVGTCTALNLLPSFRSWQEHGRPTIIRSKTPAEADVYGLKIRHLVSPLFEHTFPPFRAWTAREARAAYPLDNENMVSRLGFVATVGFLVLLAAVMLPERTGGLRDGPLLLAAARMNLAGLLLATLGGFGSLFNLLLTPEIRAYNRVTPFLAFFSLLAAGALFDAASFTSKPRRSIVLAAIVLLLGLADHAHALRRLNMAHPEIAGEFARLKALVGHLEAALPPRAMVFQLPLTRYLNDDGRARMKPYENLRPYVVSRQIHWSYPALSNSQVAWQERVAKLSIPQLLPVLRSQGFVALLVDGYGYGDAGRALVDSALALLGPASILARDERYVALDLRGVDASVTPADLGSPPQPVSGLLPRCANGVTATLDQIGDWRAPFDGRPLPVPRSRDLYVVGWAVMLAERICPEAVELEIDGRLFVTEAQPRGDVARYFHVPALLDSGFRATLPLATFEPGLHRLSVRAIEPGGGCYRQGPERPLLLE